jgi:hypothetical protein
MITTATRLAAAILVAGALTGASAVQARVRIAEFDVRLEGRQTTSWENCPTGSSDQFPQLMAWDGQDRRIGQSLPADDLFRYGKSIVVARGSKTQRVPEASAYSDITWTASFTRVRD